ncbi:MAG: DUF5722 domain-containing protein [Candidatus Ornithospirochaeta sp.]
MKTKLFTVFVIVLLFFVSCENPVIRVIVNPELEQGGKEEGGSESEDLPVSSANFVSIKSTRDEISIFISGVGEPGQKAKVYAVDSSAYYFLDTNRGLSEEVDNGSTPIAEYEGGTEVEIKIPRIGEDGRDYLFKKYYIANETQILAGPIWATDIEPEYNGKAVWGNWGNGSKKGIMIETGGVSYALDLDVKQAKLDFLLNDLICYNEGYTSFGGYLGEADSEMVFADFDAYKNNPSITEYEFDGVKYYFKEDYFAGYDKIIKELSDNGVQVTLDILLLSTTNQQSVPYYMAFPHTRIKANISQNIYSDDKKTIMVNTSNHYGAGYFGALMSFIAERYSTGEHGYVQNYILLNEVDDPRFWNSIVADSEPLPSFAEYMEEYYRTLRIASLAIADKDKDMTMLVCMENHWASTNRQDTFAPKKMMDRLIALSNAQGNFNWGIASHAYSTDLSAKDVINAETLALAYISSDPETTRFITVGNLEVYEKYLEREDRLQPDGSLRPVYLTEVGVVGSGEQQAAGIAYTYYKAEMLDCIKGYMYFTLSDRNHSNDSFGLTNKDMTKKLSYDMWKDIDTVSTEKYTSYLTSCGYYDRGSKKQLVFGEGDTYLDAIKTVSNSIGTKYDWDTCWIKMIERLGLGAK